MNRHLTNFIFDADDGTALGMRSITLDGEPWFVAADVCRALGLNNTAMALERLDEDEKGVSSIHTLGGEQQMTIVSESGLYSLILGSRKPEAKRFKRWVTGEVLPSIRKTGAYIGPDAQIAAGQQQTLFLSHAADIMVAADRAFRSAMRAGRSAGLSHAQAIRQANRITVQKTGVDMLEELNAHEHLHNLDRADAARQPATPGGWGRKAGQVPHALEFWTALQAGQLGAVECANPMLSQQLYQLYLLWVRQREAVPLNLPRLMNALCAAGVAITLRKRYMGKRTVVGPAAFIYPGQYVPPPLQAYEAVWLGSCVADVDRCIARVMAASAQA